LMTVRFHTTPASIIGNGQILHLERQHLIVVTQFPFALTRPLYCTASGLTAHASCPGAYGHIRQQRLRTGFIWTPLIEIVTFLPYLYANWAHFSCSIPRPEHQHLPRWRRPRPLMLTQTCGEQTSENYILQDTC
jgi:hypothetical protein